MFSFSNFKFNLRAEVILFSIAFHAINLINLYYEWKKLNDRIFYETERREKEVNDCIIISGPASDDCEGHLHRGEPCRRPNCSFHNPRKLMKHLNSCKRTLDICIHLISYSKIAECILKAASRGVKVRILTDAVMSRNIGSQIPILFHGGIEIRIPDGNSMHSKFAIIDSNLLIIGSLNWTTQGFHGNWDAVVITTQKELVKDFCKVFELMWEHPVVQKIKF